MLFLFCGWNKKPNRIVFIASRFGYFSGNTLILVATFIMRKLFLEFLSKMRLGHTVGEVCGYCAGTWDL